MDLVLLLSNRPTVSTCCYCYMLLPCYWHAITSLFPCFIYHVNMPSVVFKVVDITCDVLYVISTSRKRQTCVSVIMYQHAFLCSTCPIKGLPSMLLFRCLNRPLWTTNQMGKVPHSSSTIAPILQGSSTFYYLLL